MAWFYSIDLAGFKWIHESLKNPVFDWLMPLFSSNRFFYPVLAVAAICLVWKGGVRGRLLVGALLLVTVLGDGFICNSLKHFFDRARPFVDVPGTHLLVGATESRSMPSSHAANWFAATVVAWIYWRASLWFMLPLASAVAFSRVYNGVHYPADVLVGALVGCLYAAGLLWAMEMLWRIVGRRFWPIWWERLPSLLRPTRLTSTCPVDAPRAQADPTIPRAEPAQPALRFGEDQHWMRLGYVFILGALAARLLYLASGQIELSEDEAYQWTWSKHLALSYYSKPPLIAYTQFVGTWLWGDTAFGVRFFSPVISAALSLLLLRFLAREINVRAGFWLLLITAATPLLAVGSILMTIDPLSVLFWTAAMCAGWKAIELNSTRQWLWVGIWTGLGFLSKYTNLFQWLCWITFFALCPSARSQLRRRGPYLALGLNLVFAAPVLIWNYQHGWVTVTHVATDGGFFRAWHPSLRFFWDFLGAETGLLNPIFFGGAIWAAVAFWRRYPGERFLIFLFSMGAPLFLFFLGFTSFSRVLPNWIAPAVVPLFCLMVAYWHKRWLQGCSGVKSWLAAGLGLGFVAVIILHDTDLIGKLAQRPLSPRLDPLKRVRAWSTTAQLVGNERQRLQREGKPVFIIAGHYGLTGELSFYLPEARERVSSDALVYFRSSDAPENQYYFWPGYQARRGQNALYVAEAAQPQSPPLRLQNEFESIQDLGLHEIRYHGRVFRRLQLFACRGLR